MTKKCILPLALITVFAANVYSSDITPVTKWHYVANANVSGKTFLPAAYGFNVADVSDVATLNSLPPGVMGLVYIGYSLGGADLEFKSKVAPFIGNPRVFGFYLADEPDITGAWGTYYDPANLQAQSDYIHASFPNAKTFIVLVNQGADDSPTFIAKDKITGKPNCYTYPNTHIDLFGVAAYPVQSKFALQLSNNGRQFISDYIAAYVQAAIKAGIAIGSIVPVYQAFGNYAGGNWIVPAAIQEKEILNAWAERTPTPYFDYVYSWGAQKGDTSLSNVPSLQAVFSDYNTNENDF